MNLIILNMIKIYLGHNPNSNMFENYAINFSRPDKINFKYDFVNENDKNEDLELCIVVSEVIRTMAGMTGLAYSK